MKIVVFNTAGDYICRPDTTLNHNNSDYYCPEGVKVLRVVPCIYTHIDKAGKCVAERFAGRYFKSSAFGCLISDATDGASGAVATSMDFTSVMDMSWAAISEPVEYSFLINGKVVCKFNSEAFTTRFKEALVDITRKTTLRIGDIIALEAGPAVTVGPGDSITMVSLSKGETIRIY